MEITCAPQSRCSELKKVVADLIDIFLLNDHANKKAGNLRCPGSDNI